MSSGSAKPDDVEIRQAPPHQRSRNLVRTAIFAAVLYLFLETLSYGGLWTLRKLRNIQYSPNRTSLNAEQRRILTEYLAGRASYYVLDPVLGWVMEPPNTNAAGIRDDREYAQVPAPGIARFSAFGDSYTYSDEVGIPDSWAKQMAATDPSLEVLNYGTPASAPDQAYLRYLKVGTDYHPAGVFIGYMSENLERDVNVYRPFYSSYFQNFVLTKPRFRLDHGQLVLAPNPLPTAQDYQRFLQHDKETLREIGRYDYFYQNNYDYGRFDFSPSVRLAKEFWRELDQRLLNPIFKLDGMYDPRSEAFQVTAKVLDAFYRKALEDGALPVMLVFPNNDDQERRRTAKPRRYQPLVDDLRSKGYRVLDMQDALTAYSSGDIHNKMFTELGRHYSALGNGVMAKYIVSRLKEWDLMDAGKLSQAAQVERARLGN
jgi:hypothetical protein